MDTFTSIFHETVISIDEGKFANMEKELDKLQNPSLKDKVKDKIELTKVSHGIKKMTKDMDRAAKKTGKKIGKMGPLKESFLDFDII